MANIEKTLSSKERDDGKRQLLIRISSGRNIRFRIKSGIYLSPQYWDEKEQCVSVPRLGRNNINNVMEARQEEKALVEYESDLRDICAAAQDAQIELTKEWIEDAFRLKPILERTSSDGQPLFRSSSTGGLFTFSNIKDALLLEKQEQENVQRIKEENDQNVKLYEVIPEFVERRQLSHSRSKVYFTNGRLLARFEMFMQKTVDKNFSLCLHDLTNDVIEEFRDYARNEANLKAEYPEIFNQILAKYPHSLGEHTRNRKIEVRGENYIIGILTNVRTIVNWCIECGKMKESPFKGVTIGSAVYAKPIYLTIEERNRLFDFDLSDQHPMLQLVRDRFLFQCLIGCRVGDIDSLTESHIQDGYLVYVPKKTSSVENPRQAVVPIQGKAKEIIQRYSENRNPTDPLLPVISDGDYNRRLKEVFTICGITRIVEDLNSKTRAKELRPLNEIVSSHMGRRTFIGAANSVLKDPNAVCEMSGHVPGSSAMRRYYNVERSQLDEAIAAIQ